MKACIIGAGGSGIAAAQVLQARGIDFDCFEKGSVGGNWRYENDNGMSSAYRSLHINTSRRVMAFKIVADAGDYPDYPDHFQMAAYFDEVVDRFGLRERIRFGTEVLSVEPVEGGVGRHRRGARGERETNRYGAVLVANGHHWDAALARTGLPRRPRISTASRSTRTNIASPTSLRGKRVLVLGIGNSAVDIAVESSRIAEKTFVATRRGAWVLPKYLNGKPIDEIANSVTGLAADLR